LDENLAGKDYKIKGKDVDEPLLMIRLKPNGSPFAGKEGEKHSFGQLRERIIKETGIDAALKMSIDQNDIQVYGRGDLHLGILFEKLRRENFEFELSAPSVVTKKDPKTGAELTPFEKLKIEMNIEHIPGILEKLLSRHAFVEDCFDISDNRHVITAEISSKGMIGLRTEIISATANSAIVESTFSKYDILQEDFCRNNKGSLCSTSEGQVTAYALRDLEKLGSIFVSPGQQVYAGQLVGECRDETDYNINVTKAKEVTNIRTKAHQEQIRLVPARVFTIEDAISYIRDEDIVEVTPKSIRMRKEYLDPKMRNRIKKGMGPKK